MRSSSETEADVSTATTICSRAGVCKEGKYKPEAINLRFGLVQLKSDLLLARKNLANTCFQFTLGLFISSIIPLSEAGSLPEFLATSAA